MSDSTCARCDRPMAHDTAYICQRCCGALLAELHRTAGLVDELDTTIARQDRVLRLGPGRPDDLGWWRSSDALEPIPLPLNLHAVEALDAAQGELGTWARHIAETRGAELPIVDLAGCAAFLAANLDWLRQREEADEAYQAISNACRQIARIVDRAPERELVGLCACGTTLYAIIGHTEAICGGCGTTYDAAAARADLLDQARDQAVTAAQAEALLAMTGQVTRRETVRKLIWTWADRGLIEPIADGPRYRFGQILDRWAGALAARA